MLLQTHPVTIELEPLLFSMWDSESCVGQQESSGTHTETLCTSADLKETDDTTVNIKGLFLNKLRVKCILLIDLLMPYRSTGQCSLWWGHMDISLDPPRRLTRS